MILRMVKSGRSENDALPSPGDIRAHSPSELLDGASLRHRRSFRTAENALEMFLVIASRIDASSQREDVNSFSFVLETRSPHDSTGHRRAPAIRISKRAILPHDDRRRRYL